MRRWVFLLVLGLYALLWQPGFFMNDEYAQGVGLEALHDGHWYVDGDIPQGYRDIERGMDRHGAVPAPGVEGRPPVGSTMLNVVAWPVREALGDVSNLLGVHGTLVGLSSLLVAGGGYAALRLASWRTETDRRAAATGLGLLGLAGLGSQVAASPFLEIASIQLVTMLVAAFAAALFYDLMRQVGTRPLLATALYVAATPALFWSLNVKYHGMAMALAVIVVWCLHDLPRTPPLRIGLGFAVAGLGVWNHVPSGLVVLGVAGLMALSRLGLLRSGLGPALRALGAAGAGAIGLAIGLLPEYLVRRRNAAFEAPERYIATVRPGADLGDGAVKKIVETEVETGHLRESVVNESVWDAAFELFVWTDWWQSGAALSVLSIAPFVALALVGAFDRRIPLLWRIWSLAFPVALVVLGGARLLNIGAGFDIRYAATLWPMLCLTAAPVAARHVARWTALLGGLILAFVGTVNLVFHHATGRSILQMGISYEYVWFHRGAGLAAAIAPVAFLPARGFVAAGLRRSRTVLVSVAVALSASVQLLLQLGPARSQREAASMEFLYWPMRLLERFLEWMYFSFP